MADSVHIVKLGRGVDSRIRESSESLALGYLLAALRQNGVAAVCSNLALRGGSPQRLARELAASQPAVLGLNVADPTLVLPSVEFARDARRRGFAGHICAGGHTATFEADRLLCMCPEIDSVAMYEGEATICDLAETVEAGADWRGIPGVAFLAPDGHLVSTTRRPLEELDSLPFPDRGDLPYVLEHYPDVGAVPVLASRGCYFDCSFCSVRAFYRLGTRPTWRRRSIENVLEEVRDLQARFGVTDILFVDDLFLSRSPVAMDYARRFAEAIERARLRFSFTISATVDSVRENVFRSLRDAGLRQVYLGAESASPDVLKRLKKWFRPDDTRRAVETLRELDIEPSVSFINFTPGGTLRDIRTNVAFFGGLETNILQGLLNRYQVYRGTPLYDELASSGRLIGEFPHFDYLDDDPRVTALYRLCRAAFDPLLEIAADLKRSTRASRPKAAADGSTAGMAASMIREVYRHVNADVSELFLRAVDFVEGADARALADVAESGIADDLYGAAAEIAADWRLTLRLTEERSIIDHVTPTQA